MSSLVRTIEKRILKKKGFTRQTVKWIVVNDVPQMLRGTFNIIRPDGTDTGSKRWPRVA